MKNKTVILIAVLAFTSVAAATVDQPKVNQSDTSTLGIEQSDLEEETFFDSLFSSLSFSGVQNTYSPGEDINVEITATAQETFDLYNSKRVVEIYKCADSGCDDAPPIDSSSEDQCSSEEWWPSYDDCIAKNADSPESTVTLFSGSSYTWDVGFSGLNDESQYILVGYIWKDGIKTDVSKEKFRVESEGVVLDIDQGPAAGYDSGSQTVTGEVTISNNGDSAMSQRDLLEMQIRPEGGNLLSVISSTNVCDESAPENVNTYFKLDAGETKTFTLESSDLSNLEEGQNYDVRFLTRDDCYPDNDPVEPIPTDRTANTFTYKQSTGGGGGNGILFFAVLAGIGIALIGGALRLG